MSNEVNFQSSVIPDELRTLNQWVCWNRKTRNGKTTKTPIDAKSNGKLVYAKSNDPSTWADFNTAVSAVSRLNLEGIGLALAETDGLTGLDLDHVLNTETGEIDPLAMEVLEHFSGTYAETSPSGTGFRIWFYGKPPRSGKCDGPCKWLEVYSHPSNRYLTVTGNHWPGSATTVTNQQPAMDWLHSRFMEKPASTKKEGNASTSVKAVLNLDDSTLLSSASRSSNGSAFDALWSGDLSAHNGDHSAADLALLNLLAFWTGKDETRMDRLFRQSGLMRPKWDELHGENTYGNSSIGKAIDGCREIYTGQQPILTATGEPLDRFRGTDDANADLFLHQHGNDVRYCPPWEKWLLWSGKHWRIDDRLDIDRLAAELPRHLYKCAADATDSDQRRRIAKLANDLEKVNRRNTALIATRHKVVVHHSDLDQGHFLLNVANGTVDLQTGQLRQHRRNDLITHSIDVSFDPQAACPQWLLFLDSVFSNDYELIQFVQRAIGYSLTGDVREQVLLICHGVGSNGKSVFLNILRKLLGTLAIQAAPDLLMGDLKHRHPTEQADLFGKRAIICQETGDGQRFNEKLVKQLTGGDGIRARRMKEDFWEFDPTHKLWMATNHKPEIRGMDYAIWRRIRLIPFTVKFTDDGEPRKNPDMERLLTAELPGILAWAVAGCLDWQRYGLTQPEAVKAATADYQSEMDVLAVWLNDCCIVGKRYESKAADLYRSYVSWCEEGGEHAENQRKFGMRLTERGFVRFTNNGARWRGIGLLHASTRDDVTEPTEPTEPKNDFRLGDFENKKFIAEIGSVHSVHSVNQSPPVEAKPVCSRCRHLAPVPGGGKCSIHQQTITAIREHSCSEWSGMGLIRGAV